MDSEFNQKNLAEHLSRFFNGNTEEAQNFISSQLGIDPQVGKDEIFRLAANGKGIPKSHMSAYVEGDPAPGKSVGVSKRPKGLAARTTFGP